MDDKKEQIPEENEPLFGELRSSEKRKLKSMLRDRNVFILGLLVLVLIFGYVTFVLNKKDPESTNNTDSQANNLISQQTQAEISITSKEVMPGEVAVVAGSQVTWTNNDSKKHQIVSEVKGFDNAVVLEEGDSYSFTFETSGTYEFYDKMNPDKFKGIVKVR